MDRLRQLSKKSWWRLLWACIVFGAFANWAVALVRSANELGMFRSYYLPRDARSTLYSLLFATERAWVPFLVVLLLGYFLAGHWKRRELEAAWRNSKNRRQLLRQLFLGRKGLVVACLLLCGLIPAGWFITQVFGTTPYYYIVMGIGTVLLTWIVGCVAQWQDRIAANDWALPPLDHTPHSGTAHTAPVSLPNPLASGQSETAAKPAISPHRTRRHIRGLSTMLDNQFRTPGGSAWFSQVATEALRLVERPPDDSDEQTMFTCKLRDGSEFSCSLRCLRRTMPLLLRWVRKSPERFILLCSALRGCTRADAAKKELTTLVSLLGHYKELRRACFQQLEQLAQTLLRKFGDEPGFKEHVVSIIESARQICYPPADTNASGA